MDVDGVEPLTGAAQMALQLRDDVVTDGGIREQVLANAPGPGRRFLRRAEGGGVMLSTSPSPRPRAALRAQRVLGRAS